MHCVETYILNLTKYVLQQQCWLLPICKRDRHSNDLVAWLGRRTTW